MNANVTVANIENGKVEKKVIQFAYVVYHKHIKPGLWGAPVLDKEGKPILDKEGNPKCKRDFARRDPKDGKIVDFYFVKDAYGSDRPQVGVKFGDPTRLYAGNPRALAWIHGNYGIPFEEIPCVFKKENKDTVTVGEAVSSADVAKMAVAAEG